MSAKHRSGNSLGKFSKQALTSDIKALLAEAAKSNLEITPVTGEELTKIAMDVIEQPPEVVERIKKLLGQ